MYKLYVNETPLKLCSTAEVITDLAGTFKNPVVPYSGQKKLFLQYVNNHFNYNSIVFYHDDLNILFQEFMTTFKVIEAAGGIVRNNDKILVIFRRGSWDIPKGKIDAGETIEKAAIREVREETGVKATLERPLPVTYHVFKAGGEWTIKVTFWFNMTAKSTDIFIQTEEGITDAQWVIPDEFLKSYQPIYANIRDLVTFYQQNYH